MHTQRRNHMALALALALTILLLTRSAVAENDRLGIDVVRIGTDVTVPEGQVVKDAVGIGGLDHGPRRRTRRW